jgi:hypothetical protein
VKIPPAMLELFLRSSGAPPALSQLVKQVQAEGFTAFVAKPADASDPNWDKFTGGKGKQTGFWLRAESPNSRAVIGIFLEGVNDEVFQSISSLAAHDGHARV